ncbi:unnamed protein product [Candidula unifasciata]|uniref:Transmembrane protein 186 n=1 Tax=Candidula unifasciata TaxID=100452 RepID=A0A8S3ZFY4_9EUPU|nr:unnamed protein product [Candidula unifasciata]
MLCLPKLCNPTNAKYLLSCLNRVSNQGLDPVLSSSTAVRAGCLTRLKLGHSSLHTSRKQGIMGCTSFSFNDYPCKQGNVQIGHFRTIFPFSTSTKCMQENLANTNTLLEEVKAKEYITVYFNSRLKYIRFFCTLSKLSTIVFVAGTPITLAALLMNIISQNSALGALFTMGFYSFLFTGQSYLMMSKIICKIMISEDESYAKISHLNVFGKRRDVYVKVSDIVPVTGSIYDKKLLVVQFKGSSKKLFLLPNAGGDDSDFETLDMLFSGAVVSKEDKPQI